MKNLTLCFPSLEELVKFSKLICGGYLLNTINLALTASISDHYLNLAIKDFNATVVEKNSATYPY